jgi:CRP/FNR family transcriptional regulator, cyclic AMP receptor protein
MLTQVLSTVPLFSRLNEEQLEYVARLLRRRTFKERDVIVRRDTPGDALYILLSGRVKVAYLDHEDETIIAVMRAGDFFGELSVLDGEMRSADVVALETTEVLILAASDFHESIQAVPAIALSLLQQLAARVRRDTAWIRALSSQDVYGRIAQQLLYLSETHGTDVEGDGRRIGLRLTQNDLAGIVGASRESVNKAIGYFKQKGYITVDSSYHITVYNADALRKRSE